MKIISILLVVSVLCSCSTYQKKIGVDDPFSDQLEFYYRKQQSGKNFFLISAVMFATVFAYGTYFATERSLRDYTTLNSFGVWSAYILAPGFFGLGAYSFYQWSKNSNLYLETLRLQTQYYNVINPYE